MQDYDFGNGLSGKGLVDFFQSEHLVDGEDGLCILLSGIIAKAISRQMNEGRCNLFFIESWLVEVLDGKLIREIFETARSQKGQGKGITSFLCEQRPVAGSLRGCGEVLGIYFDLKDDAHACCLLPDYCGTVALFFDPNHGVIKITKANQGVIDTSDIAAMLKSLYKDDLGDDLKLRVGRYQKRAAFFFGKKNSEADMEELQAKAKAKRAKRSLELAMRDKR